MSYLDNNIPCRNEPTDLDSLQFFQTLPHQCSYLPNQIATTAFLNPEQQINNTLYSQLSAYGFRRSGRHIYKPLCHDCNACIPMRIPVDRFNANRQQKRCWKRNRDLNVQAVAQIDSEEHYRLYENYIQIRHADGDMYPPSREQFRTFLTHDWPSTRYYECRLDGTLLATSVADIMDNGISAIYSYFAPNAHKRSLGTFIILFLIEEAKRLNLPAVYLGYWIKQSDKMNYKATYRPLEIQRGEHWESLIEDTI